MKIGNIIFYVFLLLILLLGLSFAALNATLVSINYYLGISNIPLSLLLVYVLGLGILLGLLTTVFPLLKLKRENHSLKKTLKKTDALTSPPAIPSTNI